MLSRSSTKPIFVALGTATVLTLSAVAPPVTAFADPGPAFADPGPAFADPGPAIGDDPGPDPSDSPPASDPPPDTLPPDTPPPDTPPPGEPVPPPYRPAPVLNLRLTLSAGAAAPGGSVTATARVSTQHAVARHAVLRFSASSASVSGPIALGDLGGDRSVSGIIRIPAGHGTGAVTVTASLSADRASGRSATGKIDVTAAGDGEPAKAADLGGVPLLPSEPVPGLPDTAAAVGGGPAQAQLPLIAQQPAVASAELPAVRPVSLRTKASPLGLDAISYRLVWTQVAWLAALLVAVSLLLTQLRLNRRRPVVTGPGPGLRRWASGGRR